MIYAYEVTKTDEGYVGFVPDLGMKTKPLGSEDEVETVLTDGASAYMELTYRRKKKPIPLPVTSCEGKPALYVPIKLQLRILFWNTMLDQHLTQTEMAEKLGTSKMMVNFMVNGKGAVSVEKYEEALQVLGKIPDVRI